MSDVAKIFHWADYLLFVLMLAVSSGIGIFYACQSRRSSISIDTHLTGGRKMKLIPVTFSIAVSFMSAVFILGTPAEIYHNGGLYFLYGITYIPIYVISALVFAPMFSKLKLSSGYQYLERRFNSYIRVLGSATFTLEMIIYMGIVMYAPALALSQVTSFSTEMSILIMGLVCTFYTSIGGIKAVIWTDVFQIVVITAGLLALMIQGAIKVGGWQVVYERAKEGGKLPYFDMNPDPFVRHTFWTLFIGGFFTSLTVFGANQAVLQRYMSLPTVKQAKLSLLLNLPLAEFYLILVTLTGYVLYAHYQDQDPLQNGSITKKDQIVPYYMMETLSFLPGLAGLFVACIFSAALSTVSSGVNSLAVVTVVDFLKPMIDKKMSGRTPARVISILSVAVAFMYGLVATGLAFLAGKLGSTILQIALSIFGMLGGPLLGLFINGIFFPCVNHWGAAGGLFTSLAVCSWLGIGGVLYHSRKKVVAVAISTINGSSIINMPQNTLYTQDPFYAVVTNHSYNTYDASLVTTSMSSLPETSTLTGLDAFLDKWYSLSYLHYATVAVVISVFVGVLVSACTGFNRKRYVDRETYYDLLCCCKSETENDYDLREYELTKTEASPAGEGKRTDNMVDNSRSDSEASLHLRQPNV